MELFENKSRVAPFFWLHGESEDILREEIEAIYNSGIRAVCLESRTHEDFCREHWFSDVKFIMKECKKRGIKVWILDDKHFPTGYANGAFIDRNLDKRPWGITETHVDIPGNIKDVALLTDHHIWGDHVLLAVVACRRVPGSELLTGEAIDLTDCVEDNMVHFSLPEGMWKVFFIKKTRAGISLRFREYVDMLNPLSVEVLIEEVYEKHYANIKEEFGDTFIGFFSDEPSFHNNTGNPPSFYVQMGRALAHYPYSDKLLPHLTEKLGREAIRLLPGIWNEFDDGREAKIRYAFMDFITDEYRKNFCNRLASWCHEHGVLYIGHVIEDNRADASTGAGCGHYFRSLDGQDMSGIDVVLSQLIPGIKDCNNAGCVSYGSMNYNFFKYMLAKLASSMAHLDEKKHGNAMCEIFGAYGWVEGTKTMKWLSDHMLVRGINYFVPHAFSAKEDDTDCPPIFYNRGKNPEYKYFEKIATYLERGAKLISGGRHIADVALLYDAEFKWMNDNGMPLEDVAKELYESQIDYDIIPSDYLAEIKVGDGNFEINGESFKALIVPHGKFIAEETEKALTALRKKGAKIVFVSMLPVNTKECFDTVPLSELVDFVKSLKTDVSIDIDCEDIHILHYVKDNRDIYMLTNEGIDEDVSFTLKTGKKLTKCAMYDAMEDKLFAAKQNENGIEVTLAPYNSVFIISDIEGEKVPESISEEELKLNYRISLAEFNSEEYVPYKETDKLFNITGRGEKTRFSGHIKYETSFTAEEGRYLLDLGEVGEIAEVKLNGIDVGVKVIPPYNFDISKAVKQGENTLEIIVTNSNVFALRDRFSIYMRIEPSGLLGPVKIKKLK